LSTEIVDPDDKPKQPRTPLGRAQLIPQGALDRQGYRAGDFWLGRSLNGKPVGWNEDLNLLTCAGPGAGKGVATVVPNLLMYPGCAVVVDPKGELATLTAQYRRDVLGQKVVVLDPARTANVPDDLRGTYNPFDALSASDPNAVTAAETITAGLVVPNPKAPDPFWDLAASSFITACALYMVRYLPPQQRTLMRLRQVVAEGDRELFEGYVDKCKARNPKFTPAKGEAFELFLKSMADTTTFDGLLREQAANLERMGDKTLGNVLTTASTHLNFLNSPELREVLATPDDPARTFRLSQFRSDGRKLTVYVCLPVDMMPRQGRWFRVILGQITQYLERTANQFDKTSAHPVLMMMDEFFQLGPIPTITNTLTFSRSSGLRLWLILQDLNQLKANYPDTWETIIGACGIKQFFGINDHFTAEYVSKLLGDQEIEVPSVTITRTTANTTGTNRSRSHGTGRSHTEGTSESDSHGQSSSSSYSSTTGSFESDTSGRSAGTGTSSGINAGAGVSRNREQRQGNELNTDQARGGSTSESTGFNSGVSSNQGWSTSSSSGTNKSETYGTTSSTSHTHTRGRNQSDTLNENRSTSTGESDSKSTGANYGLTMQRQARRLFKPEEVILGFTRDNLTQLVHVRDQGPMLLFRTPYYMDPALKGLLASPAKDE
jgi:type IV secretion system protein VirD4